MAGYIALVHKDAGTSYGVSFPEVPGCVSAGDTFEEAVCNAAEALTGHLALMRADGDEIPAPRSFDELRRDREFAHDAADAPAPTLDSMEQRVKPCTSCHGNEGRATREGYFPRIAGKPPGYLFNQLVNFRDGRRHFPMMTYIAQFQTDDYLREIAAYFGAQHVPYPAPEHTYAMSEDELELFSARRVEQRQGDG